MKRNDFIKTLSTTIIVLFLITSISHGMRLEKTDKVIQEILINSEQAKLSKGNSLPDPLDIESKQTISKNRKKFGIKFWRNDNA